MGILINGNSHHPQATFNSILFGKAIRWRRLNPRKEDYLSSSDDSKTKRSVQIFPWAWLMTW